jgi:hypothetical protein
MSNLPAEVQTKANLHGTHEEEAQHTDKPRNQQRINELVEQILPVSAAELLKDSIRSNQTIIALKRLKVHKTLN